MNARLIPNYKCKTFQNGSTCTCQCVRHNMMIDKASNILVTCTIYTVALHAVVEISCTQEHWQESYVLHTWFKCCSFRS